MQNQYETFGNYILLEKIASGGMAEVYLAKKIAASGVQKFVAIKRILSQFSDSEDFIQMFKDEAKIAINLSHSNVVSIYDFGVQSNQFYIVMEFVEGKNLRQTLNRMAKEGKYFTPAQVVHIIKQVASGLEHAHRCIDPTTGQPLNIIHRDMSPQNVMLSFEGESKIVDFGIAKAETQIESTRAGTLKGKFGYMSPEQVEGQVIDSRTDIFALGIMTWEMLGGQRLFLANSEINTLRKIRECNVPSLRKINPNIPTELDQIVLKALKKDKSQRYQSAAELARDMQGFLSRYEPDFSIQDFSAFIKGIFSEEIIEIRKKQIVFSQVTVATQHQDFGDKTEVVTETHSEIIESLSFDEMSLNTITRRDKTGAGRSDGGANSDDISRISRERAIGGMDFSRAVPEDPEVAQRKALRKLKQSAKTKAYKVKKQTFTTQNHTPHAVNELPKRGNEGTILTVIFALSFLLALFAYINRFHPGFKTQMCAGVNIPGVCRGPAAVAKADLTIDTNPTGAYVYINGQRQKEKTPFPISKFKQAFQLDLYLPGYKNESTFVEGKPDGGLLNIKMKKVPVGYIRINSVGSEIFINGLQVNQDEKVSVPANTEVDVKVMNPITNNSQTLTFIVEEGRTISKVITPPASN